MILALIVALGLVITGVYGGEWVAGCTSATCNAVRSLQWETLTAGFLGLAGGVAVIVMTRYQLHESREAEAKVELADVDALILAYEHCRKTVVDTAFWAIGYVKADDPVTAGIANKQIENAVSTDRPEKLFNAVQAQYRLPIWLRGAAWQVEQAIDICGHGRFGVLPENTHYTNVESTRQFLQYSCQELEKAVENLKGQRERFAEILLKR
ncbi:hypothetical protein LF95_15535 [Thalassospira sp. TSL5-1]|nr:hypothetical protein LF95_15535 [Thalassospira sp. TSL5-1]